MRTLRLYIETSVWSHWYADDTPERRDETHAFLEHCAARSTEVLLYVSDAVLRELGAAPGEKGALLLGLVERFAPDVLEETRAADELAQAYLEHEALPGGAVVDAIHAALATVHRVDALVSWNCRDLANLVRRRKINGVNAMMGYVPALEIVTPLEVFADAD
jgi:predicted nucleic acid-binding protein